MNPIAELARRLASLMFPGTIAEVDHQAARCRVASGGITTAWLPWFSRRAGATRDWDPPSVGEQCLVLSPGGEPAAGFVLVGLYSQASPAPATAAPLHRREYPDGAVIDYDHESHAATLTLPAGGAITINAPAGITVLGNVQVEGTVTASEDVVAAGISLVQHRHGGVTPGGGQTGAPV
jgi:phage baseplate assembly protein V